MTARRDNTTLLRLRSSLITRNSSVFPSYGVASFTGRVSINEPGKKARMPLTMTVKPPFTLPVIVPVINSFSSSAFSRASHEARRLALSRDKWCRRSRFPALRWRLKQSPRPPLRARLDRSRILQPGYRIRINARLDHDKIVIDANDLSRDDFASPHLLMGYRGLKQCGKRFLIGIGRRGRKKLGRHKKQKIRDIGPI